MSRRRRINLFLLSLPLWVGLLSAVLAHLLSQPNSSHLYQPDLGIAAFVFGAVIRVPSVVALLFGFLVTAFLLGFYYLVYLNARITQSLLTHSIRYAEQSMRRI